MPLVKVARNGRITLPVGVRKALGIRQGDYLQVSVEGNRIVLGPQAEATKFPAVSLSEQGTRMLDEALSDIREGRVRKHDSMDSLIEDLRREAE